MSSFYHLYQTTGTCILTNWIEIRLVLDQTDNYQIMIMNFSLYNLIDTINKRCSFSLTDMCLKFAGIYLFHMLKAT